MAVVDIGTKRGLIGLGAVGGHQVFEHVLGAVLEAAGTLNPGSAVAAHVDFRAGQGRGAAGSGGQLKDHDLGACAAIEAADAGSEVIEELEQELELPPGTLAHTLRYYNEHAAQGEDPLFHKAAEYLKPMTAPHVALDCTPVRGAFHPCCTLGGLATLPTGPPARPL